MKVLAAQLNPTIGDILGNAEKILEALEFAWEKQCDLVVTSELALCGYPPEDLLLMPDFIEQCQTQLKRLVDASRGLILILGTIRPSVPGSLKPLHNSAAVIEDGQLLGFQDKSLLPTYDVFDESRYFAPATANQIWELKGERIAITICEDIWKPTDRIVHADYYCDPVTAVSRQKPTLFLNLSSSPYSFKKLHLRLEVVRRAATAAHCPAILCNQVGGNDSLVFDGNSIVTNADGEMVMRGASFSEDLLVIDTEHLPKPQPKLFEDLEHLYQALVLGLRDYFRKSGFKRALIGLSGGIDSSLVAALAQEALGAPNLLGILMPSRYSSQGSITDAETLAKNLQIPTITVPIEQPLNAFEHLLQPHFTNKPPDATEENLQARIRGMILMAISNKHGYIVLSTGNKSEMAMGYATLYGDMCGGLAVINDVSKTQVYALCHWINQHRGSLIPETVLTKPPSAELAPDQKDSDTLPDYEIVDNVLEEYVEKHTPIAVIASKYGYSLQLVEDLARRIHRNEYKRRQAPPGLRVTEKAFSVGRRFPIVQRWR